MKRFLLVLMCLGIGMISAQPKAADYIGSKKCKICHSKAEVGAQYSIWEQGPHSSSLETLKSEASKAIAKKMGLNTAPERSPECLVCHVTGWGTESGYQLDVDPLDKKAMKKNSDLSRVGCEACHGAGKLYKSKKTMIGIADGSIPAESVGLVNITEQSCTVCHNADSPTYKPFDFAVRVKEVTHPAPDK